MTAQENPLFSIEGAKKKTKARFSICKWGVAQPLTHSVFFSVQADMKVKTLSSRITTTGLVVTSSWIEDEAYLQISSSGSITPHCQVLKPELQDSVVLYIKDDIHRSGGEKNPGILFLYQLPAVQAVLACPCK